MLTEDFKFFYHYYYWYSRGPKEEVLLKMGRHGVRVLLTSITLNTVKLEPLYKGHIGIRPYKKTVLISEVNLH